jgi:hypothetical protein
VVTKIQKQKKQKNAVVPGASGLSVVVLRERERESEGGGEGEGEGESESEIISRSRVFKANAVNEVHAEREEEEE